jgi:hypothetical protein
MRGLTFTLSNSFSNFKFLINFFASKKTVSLQISYDYSDKSLINCSDDDLFPITMFEFSTHTFNERC